jgi:uncharacterized protein YbbC (DUF1343 family)
MHRASALVTREGNLRFVRHDRPRPIGYVAVDAGISGAKYGANACLSVSRRWGKVRAETASFEMVPHGLSVGQGLCEVFER